MVRKNTNLKLFVKREVFVISNDSDLYGSGFIYELMNHEPYVYKNSGESFSDFGYRFNALCRNWKLNKKIHKIFQREVEHLKIELNLSEDEEVQYWINELEIGVSETLESDIEILPEFYRLSTLSFGISLVENFLGNFGEELAKETGVDFELDRRPMPYINKHLLWLSKGCGLNVKFDKEFWKEMDIFRAIRNKFIHRVSRDLPEKITKEIEQLIGETFDGEVNDEFVENALTRLVDLVEMVEEAYLTSLSS